MTDAKSELIIAKTILSAQAEVRNGTFAVDARSIVGIFSLNLNKPVEVWFKTEVTEQTKTMDMDKYFAAKIEKWLILE